MRAAPAEAWRDPRAFDQAGGPIDAIAGSENHNSQAAVDRAFRAAVQFRARARTVALLFQYGFIDLEIANEKLQGCAINSGAVDVLGDGEVQRIISTAFDDVDIEPDDLDPERSK